LAVLGAAFEGERRGAAIGTWSSFAAISAVLGQVLGGYLIDTISWRAAFLVDVPLAIVVLLIVFRYVPESPAAHARALDLLGVLLVTVGLGGVVYGLIGAPIRASIRWKWLLWLPGRWRWSRSSSSSGTRPSR
jgi:MFS family permease